MALFYILVMFIVMVVIAVVGSVTLFLAKREKLQKVLLYIMAVFGMLVAYLHATSLAVNLIVPQIIAWVIGALGVAGLVIDIVVGRKKGKTLLISKILVVASVGIGMVNMYFI